MTARTASGAPEITLDRGPLLAAIDTRSSSPASRPRSSAIGRSTSAIAPCPLTRRISALRSADHLHGLIEIERAGDTGGGNFTHAVSDDRIGFDPHRTQQFRIRDRQRDEYRLDHVDTGQQELVRVRGRGQLSHDRPVDEAARGLVALLQRGAEHRFLCDQLTRHADPLCALAGQHEGDPGLASACTTPSAAAAASPLA